MKDDAFPWVRFALRRLVNLLPFAFVMILLTLANEGHHTWVLYGCVAAAVVGIIIVINRRLRSKQ